MATKKRFKAAVSLVNPEQFYTLSDAVAVVKKTATAKFKETLEIVVVTGISDKSDQTVRDVVALPHGTGKKLRVAVFAKDDKAREAKEAGADLIGDEELAQQVQAGKIDFDACLATPDMMALVGKIGKILGPKGLMPNPKLGTVTPQIGDAVKAVKSGRIEFRADKAGIVHVGVGKADFPAESLVANVKSFMKALLQAKPSGVKGNFIEKAYLCSTMGPAVRLDVAELLTAANAA